MSARVALAVIVAVAVPRLASARPAVIRVFEANVRAEPALDAPVVHRFAEQTSGTPPYGGSTVSPYSR